MNRHFQRIALLISFILLLGQGCTELPSTPLPAQTFENTTAVINPIPATRDSTGQPGTQLPRFATPEATIELSLRPPASAFPTQALTPVPSGVFALLFYPSLVLDYDLSIWADQSEYANNETGINYLQARDLESCKIGVEGPSGNFPAPDEILRLGEITYQVTRQEGLSPDFTRTHYIDTGSIQGFDYDVYGAVKIVVDTNIAEAKQCDHLAEGVLSTLRNP